MTNGKGSKYDCFTDDDCDKINSSKSQQSRNSYKAQKEFKLETNNLGSCQWRILKYEKCWYRGGVEYLISGSAKTSYQIIGEGHQISDIPIVYQNLSKILLLLSFIIINLSFSLSLFAKKG